MFRLTSYRPGAVRNVRNVISRTFPSANSCLLTTKQKFISSVEKKSIFSQHRCLVYLSSTANSRLLKHGNLPVVQSLHERDRALQDLKRVSTSSGDYKGLLLLNDAGKKSNEWHDDEDESSQNSTGSDGDKPPNNYHKLLWWTMNLSLLAGTLYLMQGFGGPQTSWQTFYGDMLAAGEVDHVDVDPSNDNVLVYLHPGAIINGQHAMGPGPHYVFKSGNIENIEERLQEAQLQLGIQPSDFVPVVYTQQNNKFPVMFVIISGVLMWLVLQAARRGTGGEGNKKAMSSLKKMIPGLQMTRAKPIIVEPNSKGSVGFDDVAGMGEAKREVTEFVQYLKYPAPFKKLGAKIPKGALLTGPPGTGKTLLAKAMASEAEVPFLAMAGSDFVEMFGGVGSARVRDLFKQAKKRAPCIVYIDEIDAIGKSRSSSGGGNSEQESTLNQLLVEMDGMNSVEGIVMVASTNRADVLDRALMRPGRFDRQIEIDLPTLPERRSIFEIYLRKLKLGKSLDKYASRLAELTPGKSGADIQNICNEAALHAARLNDPFVDEKNFEYAIERVIAGMEKKSTSMSPDERRTFAYHEAGHVLVNWMLEHSEPILKVSIVPRNRTIGFTQKFPLDIKLHTNEQIFDIMCGFLGGRVAEAKTFKRITTGAEDDLKRVTDMAYSQIVTFGMNERIGPISFPKGRKGEKKPYSDDLKKQIDQEAAVLVRRAYSTTEQLIEQHADKLDLLASALLERDVLNHSDLIELIGESPYGDKRKKFYDGQQRPTEQKVEKTIFDEVNTSAF